MAAEPLADSTTSPVESLPDIPALARQLRDAVEAATSASTAGLTNPTLTAAGRAAARALIHTLQRGGVLCQIVSQSRATGSGSLLYRAACSHDLDMTLALARAGARPEPHEDVYSTCFGSLEHDGVARVWAVTNDSVASDEALAHYLQALHDLGVAAPAHDGMLHATHDCTSAHSHRCLRVMVESVDGHAREVDDEGHTLLHTAARCLHAQGCAYLVSAGFEPRESDYYGCSPVGACLCATVLNGSGSSRERDSSPEAVCATLTALLQDASDGAPLVRDSGVCMLRPGAAVEYWQLLPVRDCTRMRLVMHTCAAVGAYPIAPCTAWVIWGMLDVIALVDTDWRVLQGDPLPVDEHPSSAPDIYIRDPYRITHDAHLAVSFAVTVDALQRKVDALANRDDATVQRMIGVSATLCGWAWMRRRHVVVRRRELL